MEQKQNAFSEKTVTKLSIELPLPLLHTTIKIPNFDIDWTVPQIIKFTLTFISTVCILCSILFAIVIHHKYYTVIPSIFEKGGFDEFYNTFKLSLSMLYAFVVSSTLLLTYWRINQTDEQLSLMNKQRESSYKPELFLSKGDFKAVVTKHNDGERYLHYESLVTNSKGAKIILYNVGQATAKMIKYRFFFDYERAVKLVNDYNTIIQISKSKNSYIANICKHQSYLLLMPPNVVSYSKDYLLPVGKSTNTSDTIGLNESYTYLLLLFLCAAQKANKLENAIKLFPDLYLELKYSDIGDKEYTKTFKISIDCWEFTDMYNDLGEYQDVTNEFWVLPKAVTKEEMLQNTID